ncbi:hypothetical protein SDC9_193543 [bioreactor metagenome]|uniref:Uncharacterized protein n=1 Tax=bioreactor metagenome TaxID=1076179 RepID=A0A645ICE4_9ZZZZ
MIIRVTNEGSIPARVYVRITDTNDDTANEGLHYMPFFDYEEATDSGTSQSELTKGALKQKIESTLAEYNSDFVDGIGQADALVILNAYNTSIYKVLEAGQSTDITIVFWVEYGEVENTLADTSNLTKIDYSKNVSVIATQDDDAAMNLIA